MKKMVLLALSFFICCAATAGNLKKEKTEVRVEQTDSYDSDAYSSDSAECCASANESCGFIGNIWCGVKTWFTKIFGCKNAQVKQDAKESAIDISADEDPADSDNIPFKK